MNETTPVQRTRFLMPVIVGFLAAFAVPDARRNSPSESQSPSTRGVSGSITIDASKTGARISSNLYGIFYEEISHAGDGGLYAELVQNRGFEDANPPPACVLENGFVVPPRTPHFDNGRPSTWRLRWDVTSPHPAWRLDATNGNDASIALTVDRPLTADVESMCALIDADALPPIVA